MILVLLGTQDKPFKRLIEYVEKLVKEGVCTEEIIVQSGNTPYESKVLNVVPFVDHNEMNKLISKSSFVVTHAGIGSIVSVLKSGKKVIVIPRRYKFGEHVNDHQIEISNYFFDEGYINTCEAYEELKEIVSNLDTFEPKVFIEGNKKMVDIIDEFMKLRD